jgi:hypothetical protein
VGILLSWAQPGMTGILYGEINGHTPWPAILYL